MEIDDSIALEENAKRKNQFDSMVEESKQEERVSKLISNTIKLQVWFFCIR